MIISDVDSVVKNYTDLKKSFKIRSSSNYVELITSTGQKIYHNKNEKFKGGLYLFQMVKKDVEKYLAKHGGVEPYDELPVNYANQNYDYDKDTIGMDINNAYWSVAKLKGYISRKTYNKGIEKEGLKTIRLSSLSSLGKTRVYKCYTDGVYTHDESVNGDVSLQNVYLDIRYSTYGVMMEVAELLGDDFCCWKTDCIFFTDTEDNRWMVKSAIESYGLECKVEIKDSLKKINAPKTTEQ